MSLYTFHYIQTLVTTSQASEKQKKNNINDTLLFYFIINYILPIQILLVSTHLAKWIATSVTNEVTVIVTKTANDKPNGVFWLYIF